jgi:hypothetical protein
MLVCSSNIPSRSLSTGITMIQISHDPRRDLWSQSRPATEAVDRESSKEAIKRKSASFTREHVKLTSSLRPGCKDCGIESDRSMYIISATLKSDLFGTTTEESFPRIIWEDNQVPDQLSSKRRKRNSYTIIETDREQSKQPRRSRLLRSKRIHSRLCMLQESSLIASSYYQYCIQKSHDTSLWLDTIANFDVRNLVKDDEGETRQDSTGFEFPMQVVA